MLETILLFSISSDLLIHVRDRGSFDSQSKSTLLRAHLLSSVAFFG